MRRALVCMTVLVAVVGLGAGCLETETPLTPPGQGVVDVKLIGDWSITGDDGKGTTDVLVRNFDGHRLYVELREGDRVDRYAAHITVLKGASFAQLRPLTDDGTVETKHFIMRVDRAGDDKINLRHLDKAFFGGQSLDAPEKLRAAIEQNVDNAAMYEGDPMPMTRKRE